MESSLRVGGVNNIMDIASNLEQVEHEIEKACLKVNRKKEDITIIGVTKYVTIERTEELINAGINNLGENRTEGFLEKYAEIGKKAKWHFIGTLQSRKVKDIIDHVSVIHSLDRLSVAKQIETRADRVIDCFVQVNVAEESSKHGLSVGEVIPFIKELAAYKQVNIIGLMTMAPYSDDEQKVRDVFKELASLKDEIQKLNLSHAPCDKLSMGMSNDYTIAVEEGATHIRIGSKLVG